MPKCPASDIDKQIGANIARWRTTRGVSRPALGAAMKNPVSGVQIHKYETGETRIPAACMVDIAAALDCHIIDLVENVENVHAYNAPVKEIIRSRGDETMMRAYSEMPDNIRESVRNMCTAIVIELTNHYRKIEK